MYSLSTRLKKHNYLIQNRGNLSETYIININILFKIYIFLPK
jgi:hypothetical protein